MNNWEWTETTNEEFNNKIKTSSYYRIYHVDETGNEINDYKFWAPEDSDAISIWEKWNLDHKDDRKYFWGNSEYFVMEGKDKRYDSLEEMHNEFACEPYDKEDRQYDEDLVKSFLERMSKKENVLEHLKELHKKLGFEISQFEQELDEVKHNQTDFENDSEDEIKKLTDKVVSLDDKFYEFEELESVMRTKHFKNESWDLIHHVLDDLKHNLAIMSKKTNGYPSEFEEKAKTELGTNSDKKTISELANKLWHDELAKQLENVCGYMYFLDFGIVDDNDVEVQQYVQKNKPELPILRGTNEVVDYVKLGEITTEKWNSICDWIKKHGRDLWD